MDNIIAIASPIGTGAISLIRASGDSIIDEFNKVFKGKNLNFLSKNTFTFGHIIDENNNIIDDVILLLYKAPNSYTGEDLIEITTHGGVLITENVLNTIIKNTNIRLAEPGEFTKRAYLNNKLDIIQAESIMALINAESNNSLKVARCGLDKKISNKISLVSKEILDFLTMIEVDIDYPEFEKENYNMEKSIQFLDSVIEKLEKLKDDSKKTSIIANGINIAIIGLPNVGKSSLLNTLLKEKRAIVSNIPGTTRDIIKESIYLSGFKINLIDTAGIRKTSDEIEKMGVDISTSYIKKSDLIILILDASCNNLKDNLKLVKLTKNKPRIICLNKTDKNIILQLDCLGLSDEVVKISALKNKGIDILKNRIIEKFKLNKLSESDFSNLFSKRQINKLDKAIIYLKDAIKNIKNDYDLILLASDIKKSYDVLLEIIGKVYDNDLEKNIFKNFCLGK